MNKPLSDKTICRAGARGNWLGACDYSAVSGPSAGTGCPGGDRTCRRAGIDVITARDNMRDHRTRDCGVDPGGNADTDPGATGGARRSCGRVTVLRHLACGHPAFEATPREVPKVVIRAGVTDLAAGDRIREFFGIRGCNERERR